MDDGDGEGDGDAPEQDARSRAARTSAIGLAGANDGRIRRVGIWAADLIACVATMLLAEDPQGNLLMAAWRVVVEMRGLEPLTPAMRTRCSPG